MSPAVHSRPLLAALSIWVMAGCNDATPDSKLPSLSTPPRLDVDHEVLDLGEVPVSATPHAAVFKLTNRGAEPLVVSRLELSCSCLDVSIDSRSLPSMEAAELRVLVKSTVPEERQATLSVHSNDPVRRKVPLTVQWRAVAALEFDPLVVDFGTVRPGTSCEREVRLIRREFDGGPSCQVTSLAASNPEALTVISDAVANQQRYQQIRLRLQAGQVLGGFRAFVAASIDCSDIEDVRLPVSWAVHDAIETSPKGLFLGFVSPEETVRKKIIVTCDAGERLTVSGARFERASPLGEVAIEQISESIVAIDVAAVAPVDSGEYADAVEIECAGPEHRRLSVPVRIVVRVETES